MTLEITTQDLLPCPFCGAKPHQGLGKLQYCQLHGDPFQRFHIKCPKGHAEIDGVTRERAVEGWNARHRIDSTAELREAPEKADRALEAMVDEIHAQRNAITHPNGRRAHFIDSADQIRVDQLSAILDVYDEARQALGEGR